MSGGLIRAEAPARIRVSGPAARRGEARDAVAARVYELLARCRSFQRSGLASIVAEDVADRTMRENFVDLDAAAERMRAAGRRPPAGEAPITVRVDRLDARYTNAKSGGWRRWVLVIDDEVVEEPGGARGRMTP